METSAIENGRSVTLKSPQPSVIQQTNGTVVSWWQRQLVAAAAGELESKAPHLPARGEEKV